MTQQPKTYLNYIGGEWTAASTGQTDASINPADQARNRRRPALYRPEMHGDEPSYCTECGIRTVQREADGEGQGAGGRRWAKQRHVDGALC